MPVPKDGGTIQSTEPDSRYMPMPWGYWLVPFYCSFSLSCPLGCDNGHARILRHDYAFEIEPLVRHTEQPLPRFSISFTGIVEGLHGNVH